MTFAALRRHCREVFECLRRDMERLVGVRKRLVERLQRVVMAGSWLTTGDRNRSCSTWWCISHRPREAWTELGAC